MRTEPLVAQPPKGHDARQRYTYAFIDVDDNGQRDSLVFDRDSGLFTVRLYGAFGAGHPYAGVDQEACTVNFWKHNLAISAKDVNLDYCNAVIRPEENWGHYPVVDRERDRIRIFEGRFSETGGKVPLVWDESRIAFARANIQPDPIGRRPGITQRFAFDFATIDLSKLDVCKVVGLHPTELERCTSNRWRNLARLWESVAIGDLDLDGLDDIVGLVAVDDDDPRAELGLWSLVSTKAESGAVEWIPKHLGNVSANYRGASIHVGDFDGSKLPQILFVRANDQLITSLRFDCRVGAGTDPCGTLVARESTVLANLATSVPGTGAMTIDEIDVGRFVDRSSSSVRMRIKRASEPNAREYVLYADEPQAMKLARWNCPWQASTLDPMTANAACLHTSPLAVPEIAARTMTRFVTPEQCGADCRPVIQAHLDDPEVRNVILKDGSFPVAGTVRLSTLDAHAAPTARTKRLIGMNATVVGRSRYHRIQPRTGGGYDVLDIVPVGAHAIEAEVRAKDKCREFRSYDDYDATTGQGYVKYDPHLSNRFVALRDRYIIDHCGVVETLGNDITISDLTIDTDELAKIKEQRSNSPTYDAISLGYYANGWSLPYLDAAGTSNTNAAHRIIDTSRSVDERLSLRRLRFVHHPDGAIATYSTPHSVRDTVVEDVRCEAFPSTSGVVSSNCIELDAAPLGNFPYDVSYREHIPFSPAPVENFTVRKGPNADSVCDMTGNNETVRVSGAIGLLIENCRVQRGFGNAALFLYVTDTGAKLDATLRNVHVDMDISKIPPVYRYDPSPIPYIPRRFDAAGHELFQGHEMKHQGLIQIIGRPVSRSAPFNYRIDLANDDPRLDKNERMNEFGTYFSANYVYRATPSQVTIDGLASVIEGGTENDADTLYRAHIKEGVGLTGKFVCKDCDFKGGGQILSADYWDLVGYMTVCLNEPAPNGDPNLLTADEKACARTAAKAFKTFAPGYYAIMGYDSDGQPITKVDPNETWSRAHGGWFEFLNLKSANIHHPRAMSIIPGSVDKNASVAFRPTPAQMASFSGVVKAP